MDTMTEYFKNEMNKYYKKYNEQNTLSALMTGTIQGFLKYSNSLSIQEKKNLANSIIWAYEKAGIELSGNSKEIFEKFSKEKSLDF